LKKISFFLFLFLSNLSFSQKKDKIVVKQQDQILFYQMGEKNDSVVVKNISDLFLVKLSSDKKKIIEVKLKNATFIKTDDENVFKLVHTPGMKYRMVYALKAEERAAGNSKDNFTVNNKTLDPLSSQIATDGAVLDGSKEIVIELIDTQKEKVLITNTFTYKEK
jgi:hypothetical protein